jgi:dissimilatory sulfite reductase (desulfoviridin) alpha/beta subunit
MKVGSILMLNPKTIERLASEGILAQKQDGYFYFRILSRAGNFSSKELTTLSIIAKKYGHDYLEITSHLAIEIPWIHFNDIDTVKNILSDENISFGGTGKKLRPIVACKGNICFYGLYDTKNLGSLCHDRFINQELPGKTTIIFAGCPNNCVQATTADIGVIGQSFIQFDHESCIHCEKCISICKSKALTFVDDHLIWNKTACNNCGKCADVCTSNAITEETRGISIYLGGRTGRHYHFGVPLTNIYPIEEIPHLLEIILMLYKELANKGERLHSLLERIGFNAFENKLIEKL